MKRALVAFRGGNQFACAAGLACSRLAWKHRQPCAGRLLLTKCFAARYPAGLGRSATRVFMLPAGRRPGRGCGPNIRAAARTSWSWSTLVHLQLSLIFDSLNVFLETRPPWWPK